MAPLFPLAPQSEAAESASRPPALLVVNDDPASLLGLTGLLERWSQELQYEIVSANSGEAALREVLQREFAAILLDVNMPGLDGFETAELIHSRPLSAGIPIIFITAYWSDEVVRVKAYQNGAVDYLFTPVVPEVLRAKVSVFVGLARKTIELRDQTELLERRTAQLEKMNVLLREEIEGRIEAERRDREKDEFLAMLGHELRNPLAAITNAADIMRDNSAQPSNREFAAEVIQRQSHALNEIVDDLLNLGRVMYGKVSLDRKPEDLARLAAGCLRTFDLSGKTGSHQFKSGLSTVFADIDVIRFEQVIGNLLDNALKYTPPGGEIMLRVEQRGDDAVIEIEDTGVGMEPDLLERVFDTFVQGPSAPAGGLGIGLALVRQLVLMHGGTVEAFSEGAGRGSRFVITLPALGQAGDTVSEAAKPEERRQQGSTVLLVDDNDDVRETLALVLEASGCTVFAAPGGLAALALLERQTVDVALIDIGMPDVDGHEVARRVRARGGVQPRLIALTGFGTESAFRDIKAAGFDAHLTKPVRMEELLSAIAVRPSNSVSY